MATLFLSNVIYGQNFQLGIATLVLNGVLLLFEIMKLVSYCLFDAKRYSHQIFQRLSERLELADFGVCVCVSMALAHRSIFRRFSQAVWTGDPIGSLLQRTLIPADF